MNMDRMTESPGSDHRMPKDRLLKKGISKLTASIFIWLAAAGRADPQAA